MLSWKGFLKLTLPWPSLFVMVLKVEDQLYTIGKLQSMCIFGFFSQNTNLILVYPFEIFHPRTITYRRIIAPFWGNCQYYVSAIKLERLQLVFVLPFFNKISCNSKHLFLICFGMGWKRHFILSKNTHNFFCLIK